MKKTFALALFVLLVFSGNSVSAFDYTITIEGDGTEDLTLIIGDIVHLAFDANDMDVEIYGNIQVEFDPTALEAIYVDESYDYWGFWTGWTTAPVNPDICGGGEPYYYATGYGSDRGDLYAASYGDYMAGPSAYIDNINGTIRFYHMNSLSPGFYEPLRLGFRILKTGPVDITIKSQAETKFDWCDFDAEVTTQFMFGVPLTSTELVAEIVRMMTIEFDLPGNVENSYSAELKKIQAAIDRDRPLDALNEIDNFVKKIEKDINRADISSEQGAWLIDMAYDLYDSLSG